MPDEDIDQPVRRQRDKLKAAREQELDDLRVVLSTTQGKRFVAMLLKRGGVFSTTHTQDARHSAFLEGQRNAALMLVSDIAAADPQMINALIVEVARGSR